jgi:hypothetical protein
LKLWYCSSIRIFLSCVICTSTFWQLMGQLKITRQIKNYLKKIKWLCMKGCLKLSQMRCQNIISLFLRWVVVDVCINRRRFVRLYWSWVCVVEWLKCPCKLLCVWGDVVWEGGVGIRKWFNYSCHECVPRMDKWHVLDSLGK